MHNHLAHTGKITTKVCSSAFCKAVLAIVLSSLALPCFPQTAKMERLFQIQGSMFPEVMLRWTLDGGCFYYKTMRADFIDDLEKYKQTYEWSGECIEGQPLSGSGELLGLSINYLDEYVPDETPTVGRMVNGRWDGFVRKGENSYTYRNGCMSENLCRQLFNQLDASLEIKPTLAESNLERASTSTAAIGQELNAEQQAKTSTAINSGDATSTGGSQDPLARCASVIASAVPALARRQDDWPPSGPESWLKAFAKARGDLGAEQCRLAKWNNQWTLDPNYGYIPGRSSEDKQLQWNSKASNMAIAKVEICINCGIDEVPDVTLAGSIYESELGSDVPQSTPTDNWETSPGIRP